MPNVITALALAASFAARFPGASTIDSLQASGETLERVDAAAVRGFASVSGKLQWIRSTEHFLVKGEPVYVGDYVQVEELDAKRIVNAGRAELATEAEAAEAASKKGSKG